MSLPAVFEPFVEKSALPVMVRAVLERAFCDQVFDSVFSCFARQQHCRKLLFSTCVDLMADVVTRVQPTLRASMRNKKDLLPVRFDCVYDKIAALEDDVVSAAVAVTAADLADLVDAVGGALPSLVPGLRTLVLDGNHLQAVQHRVKPLRGLPQAALPGTCVALLDADRRMFVEVFLQQDGHASEMQVLSAVPTRLKANDLLLADRNFCCRAFAAAMEDRGAFFLLREHGNRFPLQLLGQRQFVGETETGRVYEQQAVYEGKGASRAVRRITVELFKPTRNQDHTLYLLSNLPQEVVDPAAGETVAVTALTIAKGYRQRWSVENAFHTLTVELNCELNTLGYPPAALFGFCVAAMCYNAYSAAMAAVRGHFGTERVEREFSTYYMANDIRTVWTGMHIAIPDHQWAATFSDLTLPELATYLLQLASRIHPDRYKKAKTRPRRPPVKGASKRAKSKHTSVAKELKKHKSPASN
jgi:hypothetical protein